MSTTSHGPTSLVIALVWPYADWGGAQTHLLALARELSEHHRIVAFVPADPSVTLRDLISEVGVQVIETGPATRSSATESIAAKIGRRVVDRRAHRATLRAVQAADPPPDVFHVDIPAWNGTGAVLALLRIAPVVQTYHTPLPSPTGSFGDRLLRHGCAVSSVNRASACTRPRQSPPTRSGPGSATRSPSTSSEPSISARSTRPAPSRSPRSGPSSGSRPGGRSWEPSGNSSPARVSTCCSTATARLVEDGRDLHVLLGGEGPEAERLVTQAETLGLTDRLTLVHPDILGPTHAAELAVLVALDLLVMPSRDEGLPLTLLEGLALGRPALVSDVGAIGAVFTDGADLVLTEPDDLEQLIRSMERLVDDADERGRWPEPARNGSDRPSILRSPPDGTRRSSENWSNDDARIRLGIVDSPGPPPDGSPWASWSSLPSSPPNSPTGCISSPRTRRSSVSPSTRRSGRARWPTSPPSGLCPERATPTSSSAGAATASYSATGTATAPSSRQPGRRARPDRPGSPCPGSTSPTRSRSRSGRPGTTRR